MAGLEPRQQSRKSLLRLVVPHRHRERLPLPDQHDELLAPGDAGVNQVALQQQVMLCRERDHDRRELRALRLVNRDGVGQRRDWRSSGWCNTPASPAKAARHRACSGTGRRNDLENGPAARDERRGQPSKVKFDAEGTFIWADPEGADSSQVAPLLQTGRNLLLGWAGACH